MDTDYYKAIATQGLDRVLNEDNTEAGDRDVIVSGSDDGTVRVWDAVTGAPAGAPLAGLTRRVYAVAIGRAGNQDIIVSGSDDRTVLIRQHRPR